VISTILLREKPRDIDLMNIFAYDILHQLDRWQVAYRKAELDDKKAN
jgi:hypothetical protein